jgi:hypothetical protein
MNSSSETWHGTPNLRATRAVAWSIGVGPQANIPTSASAASSSVSSQRAARSVT